MCMEGSTATSVKARMEPLYRGLRPGHGIKRTVWEPGRSRAFSRHGVVADKPKRGGSHDDALEVGPTHRRGVVRVMSGASTGLTRRGWQLHAERGGDTHHA